LVSLYSTIKMMHGPINIRIQIFDTVCTGGAFGFLGALAKLGKVTC